MNKYEVTETVPYESETKWVLFADTPEEARQMVKQYEGSMGEHLEPLSVTVKQWNITGTKEKKVLRKSTKHNY